MGNNLIFSIFRAIGSIQQNLNYHRIIQLNFTFFFHTINQQTSPFHALFLLPFLPSTNPFNILFFAPPNRHPFSYFIYLFFTQINFFSIKNQAAEKEYYTNHSFYSPLILKTYFKLSRRAICSMPSNRPFGKTRFSLLLQYIQTVKGSLILPEMKMFLFVKVLICLLLLKNTRAITCPLNTLDGYILSGTITAALSDAVVPLDQQEDYFCYNYSLQYKLSHPPEIAISVHDFEVEVSKNLFFYIKTYYSESTTLIPFVIRTQWAYTSWVKITFSFLAQDRTDIQSGYYQVDSGLLSSSSLSRNVPVFLPFRSVFNHRSQIKYILFLHGFQITTIKQLRGRTPFEIQLIKSQVNTTGISVTVSMTTLTKIDSIFISYVAIQNNKFRMEYGKYIYESGGYNTTLSNIGEGVIQYLPKNQINRNYARLYGLSGFIFNHLNTTLKYQTIWDSSAFKFTFNGNLKQNVPYFTFDYIFFLGSTCEFCYQYPFQHEGTCVNNCPTGTSKTYQNICINCGTDKVWNGTNCVKFCIGGQFLNIQTNMCQCPPLYNWNGNLCVICTSGKIFNTSTNVCQCPNGQMWDGNKCSIIPPCVEGKNWNYYTFSCECPESQFWNVSQCSKKPSCQGGQILNRQFKCVCPNSYYWNGQSCTYQICFNGMIWTGTQCVCPVGLHFNKTMCVQCINGQKWNTKNQICQCQEGFQWNGMFCEKSKICDGKRLWNEFYQQCICEDNMYWNGFICKQIQLCPSGQYFDFTKQKCLCKESKARVNQTLCIVCPKGKIWKQSTGFACICPFGSIELNGQCHFSQLCTGGKIWLKGIKSCQCPINTLWNGSSCSIKVCPNGKISTSFMDCQCPSKTVLYNGYCLPIRSECQNGRIWSEKMHSCQCPSGKYMNFAQCQDIPVCGGLKVYNHLSGTCDCPIGTLAHFEKCQEVPCKQNQFYNGFQCQVIYCPPPTYFKDNKCVRSPRIETEKCPFSYYWNGFKCQYYSLNCPSGTKWENLSCISRGDCKYGQYRVNGNCTPFSQLCHYPLFWKENKCTTSNGSCPQGTYYSLNRCQSIKVCSKGFTWSSTLLRCICGRTSFFNGNKCIECGNQKEWKSGIGCVCPIGQFDTGSQCTYIKQEGCRLIANAFWKDKNKCLCRPGFIKKGMHCICKGVQIGKLCDMCSHKPNSIWVQQSNSCNCKKDYVEYKGDCLSLKKGYKGSHTPQSCTVGTYYQRNLSMCLSCSDGCLSCKDYNKCIFCMPQYFMEVSSEKCYEICGDGKKFTNQCDDGNNEDGDGCSKECKIEKGFNCLGGSPFSSDACFLENQEETEIELLGQIRKQTSIILELRVSNLPFTLLSSKDMDPNIFEVKFRDKSELPVNIQTNFQLGTQYIFLLQLNYGRPYIGSFEAEIGILGYKKVQFFGGRSIKRLDVRVQPKYLYKMSAQPQK